MSPFRSPHLDTLQVVSHQSPQADLQYACQNFNGGAQCSDDQTWQLHQQMAAWFDEQDYVERYSPFGAMRNMQGVNQFNALMNPDGSITSLGSWVCLVSSVSPREQACA